VSLYAPLAVPVEIRVPDRRVFRLSTNVAESGITLEHPAPFEVDQPVTVTFTLPDVVDHTQTTAPLTLRAVVALTDSDGDGTDGGRALEFVDPSREVRQAMVRYVAARLGLPGGAPQR
jgi:hypothetical protein